MICILPGRRAPRRAGFSLPEVLAVVVIMGIMAAMAGPPMMRWLQTIGSRTAANMLASDIAMARVQAVREGRTASLRVVSPTVYQVTLDDPDGTADVTIKQVDVTQHQSTARLSRTGRIPFDSRGLLSSVGPDLIGGLSVNLGTQSDSLIVTGVGRVQRVK